MRGLGVEFKKLVLFLAFLVIISSVQAQVLSIYVKPYPTTPNTAFDYVFNFTSDSGCSNVLASFNDTITTDAEGIGFTTLNITNVTVIPGYLCEYRDSSLRSVHTLYFPWLRNYNDIFTDFNVGIKYPSPETALHVNGTIRTNITSCSGDLETTSDGDIYCGTDDDTQLSGEQVQDYVGAMAGEGLEYSDGSDDLHFDCSEVTDNVGDHLTCSGENLVVTDDWYDSATDVIGGFTNCTGTQYLGADGVCHNDTDTYNTTEDIWIVVDNNTFIKFTDQYYNTTQEMIDAVNGTALNLSNAFGYDLSNHYTKSESNSLFFSNITNFTGSLTDGMYCIYNATNGEIDCNQPGISGNSTEEIQDAVGQGFTNGLIYDDVGNSFYANNTYLAQYFVNVSDWSSIDDYPVDCAAGLFVTGLGDTLTCAYPTYNTTAEILAVTNNSLHWNASLITANNWSDVNISESQIWDLTHTIDTDTWNTTEEIQDAIGGALNSSLIYSDSDNSFAVNESNLTITESQISDLSHTVDTYNTTEEVQDAIGNAFNSSLLYNDADGWFAVNESNLTITESQISDLSHTVDTYNTTGEIWIVVDNGTFAYITSVYNKSESDSRYFSNLTNFTGTLTDGKICIYNETNHELDCNYTDNFGGNTTAEILAVTNNSLHWNASLITADDWSDVVITESQISDLSHTVDTYNTSEEVQDAVGTIFNSSLIYNDAEGWMAVNESNLTITESQISDLSHTVDTDTWNTTEEMQDAVGSGFTDGLVYTDAANTFTFNISYGAEYFVNVSDWSSIDDYPTDCASGLFVTGIGDTLTCNYPTYNTTAEMIAATNNSIHWNSSIITADDWSDVIITESQISDLSHTVDTYNTSEEMQDAVGSGFASGLNYNDGANTFTLNTSYVADFFVNRSDWTTIDDYPTSCNSTSFVRAIGDTLTCDEPSTATTYTADEDYINLNGSDTFVFNETTLNSTIELHKDIKNVITVSMDGVNVDYDNIKEAIDSITDSNATNRYEVVVHPGVYSENNITIPDYVTLKGNGFGSTIISNDTGFILNMSCEECYLVDLTIDYNPATTGDYAVYIGSGTVEILNVRWDTDQSANDINSTTIWQTGGISMFIDNIFMYDSTYNTDSSNQDIDFFDLDNGSIDLFGGSVDVNVADNDDDFFFIDDDSDSTFDLIVDGMNIHINFTNNTGNAVAKFLDTKGAGINKFIRHSFIQLQGQNDSGTGRAIVVSSSGNNGEVHSHANTISVTGFATNEHLRALGGDTIFTYFDHLIGDSSGGGDIIGVTSPRLNDLEVSDDLYIGQRDGGDDDFIYFDTGTNKRFGWNQGTGTFEVNDDILPNNNATKDLGDPSTAWDNIYADDYFTVSAYNDSIDTSNVFGNFTSYNVTKTGHYANGTEITYTEEHMNHSSLPEWARTVEIKDDNGTLFYDNGTVMTETIEHGVSVNRILSMIIDYFRDVAIPKFKDLYDQVQWIEDEGKTRLSCPSNFTDVGMGCLQTAEEGSSSATAAASTCHNNYEGRLPSAQELSIGFSKYVLTDESDDSEWTGDLDFPASGAAGGQRCVYMDASSSFTDFGAVGCGNTGSYRCFLPYGNDYE